MFDEDPTHFRRQVSYAASVLVHAAVVLWLGWWWPEEPDEKPIELQLVQRGDRPVPGDAPAAPAAPAPPQPPRPPKKTPPPAPSGDHAVAVEPPSEVEPPAPAPPRPTPAPTSFADWQRSRASSLLPSRLPPGGSPDGQDLASRQGRDRCVPPTGRRVDRVYLLFDSSGSMTDNRQAEALGCAHQYARAALEGGAEVVVGNFARGVEFTAPTRDPLDIESALRGLSDKRATVLPGRELQPFLDAAPGAVADLVIVSDGWFEAAPEVLIWYRYFLDLNHENRGTMYTVGAPGHRAAVSALRDLGFDVYVYDQVRGR